MYGRPEERIMDRYRSRLSLAADVAGAVVAGLCFAVLSGGLMLAIILTGAVINIPPP
jgi:hypothetical protein